MPLVILTVSFSAVRPEEHSTAGVRCPERLDGDEYYQQGEERDQVVGSSHEFRPRVPEAGAGGTQAGRTHQAKDAATTGPHSTSKCGWVAWQVG